MCSWFCETFCCFLLRFRDSCTQNISTPTHSQSRSFEADRLGIRQDGERGRELSTVSRDAARGGHVADIQSRPITPIPQYIFTTSQTSDRTQSIRIIAFDGEEDPTRLGSRLGTLPLRSSSAFSTHSAAPIEDGGGDIGLLSVRRQLFEKSTFRLQDPAALNVKLESHPPPPKIPPRKSTLSNNARPQDLNSDHPLRSPHAVPTRHQLHHHSTPNRHTTLFRIISSTIPTHIRSHPSNPKRQATHHRTIMTPTPPPFSPLSKRSPRPAISRPRAHWMIIDPMPLRRRAVDNNTAEGTLTWAC